MALITRFTRLFKADMHAVLDRLEEPAVLLRQAIREMEEKIAGGARSLKAHETERQQMAARLQDLQTTLAKVEDELALCFDAGNETLARTIIRRRLENEALAKHLEQHLARLTQLIAEQSNLLDEERRRLEGMRQKASVFEVEPASTDAAAKPDDFAVTEADVELALLREQQKRRSS
jgi:phage shock protein A